MSLPDRMLKALVSKSAHKDDQGKLQGFDSINVALLKSLSLIIPWEHKSNLIFFKIFTSFLLKIYNSVCGIF